MSLPHRLHRCAEMVDHERPGTIDMRKVNLSADDKNALGNYKALEAALSKIGVDRNSMDIQNLTKGQPQATLELLQTLHQHLVGGGGEADTPRGAMSSLDPNVEGSAGSRKRKAALPGGPRQARKARSAAKVDEEMAAVPEAPAEEAGAAVEAEAKRAEGLHAALQEAAARLRQSEHEARSAREEADFYYSKLVRIEARRAHVAPP